MSAPLSFDTIIRWGKPWNDGDECDVKTAPGETRSHTGGDDKTEKKQEVRDTASRKEKKLERKRQEERDRQRESK